jgi:hypothetical protein
MLLETAAEQMLDRPGRLTIAADSNFPLSSEADFSIILLTIALITTYRHTD